ncbi:DMT family transporter [Noviherbaspirillum agri]
MAPVYVRLVLVALFWGGTFIAGRMIAGTMSGMLAATIRYAIAVPLLLLVAWRFEGGLPRLNLRQLLLTFGLGLTGIFLYNVCFFAALAQMPAGRTALFVAFNPIVTALLLSLLLRERVGPIKWLGIGMAFIGAAVIVTRGDIGGALRDISRSFGTGEGFMLLGVTGWAAYTLIGRTAMKSLSPIAATTYASLWGLVLLACGAWVEAGTTGWAETGWAAISWADLAALAYLGLFGTVISFVWYYQGVKAIGAAQTAVFNNLVPVFGILLAAVLLSEPILTSMIIGGVLVITGVTLTNRPPKATDRSFGSGEATVASGNRP